MTLVGSTPRASLHNGRPLKLNAFSAYIPMDRIGGLSREDLHRKIEVGPLGGYLFNVEHRDYITVRSFIGIRREIERTRAHNDTAHDFNRFLIFTRMVSIASQMFAISGLAVYSAMGIAYMTNLWPEPFDLRMLSTMPQGVATALFSIAISKYLIKLTKDAENLHDFLIQASYPDGPRIDPRYPSRMIQASMPPKVTLPEDLKAVWPDEHIHHLSVGVRQIPPNHKLNALLMLLGIPREARILDIGAFDNLDIEGLRPFGYRNGIGIDVAEEIGSSSHGRRMNFRDLAPYEKFDVIFFNDLLDDFGNGGFSQGAGPSYELLAKKILIHLNPGGHVIFKDLSMNSATFSVILKELGLNELPFPPVIGKVDLKGYHVFSVEKMI